MSTRGVGESLARLVVRAAARSVSIGKRERFIREWDAELWQAARSDASVGPRPVRMAFGAFADARALSSWERRGRVRVIETMEGFFTDVRVAARGLRRVPGFAVVAVLTLGLGLGATTAMMTIVDTVVLRPLPYPEPGRLVQLKNAVPGVGDGTDTEPPGSTRSRPCEWSDREGPRQGSPLPMNPKTTSKEPGEPPRVHRSM